MSNFLSYYQHIPEHLNPDISFGFFSISWYSIMYIIGFATVYVLTRYRINRGEYKDLKIFNFQFSIFNQFSNDKISNFLIDFLLYVFIGLIIGARLGEVLFYNFSYYAAYPIRIISPFDPLTHKFVGIYGMSYHGGLIGVTIAAWIWSRRNKINLLNWANFIIPAVPLGYFFGRIGNFINGELYGRITNDWWGMYFPGDKYNLRHPSQLYEAFLEGILLFVVLWLARNTVFVRKYALVIYLCGYAAARIIAEFFREPDGLIGLITLGQFYSFFMILAAIFLFIFTRKSDIIKERNSSPTTFSLAPKAQKTNFKK